MQRRALLSSSIAALGSLAGCVGAFGTTVTAEVTETHGVSPETVVSIGNRNGDVDADCLAMRGDVTCRTTSGDATVSVGEDVSATVRLETTNGSVTTADLPLAVDGERQGFLRGQVRGGGESTLFVRSTNGDVGLEAAE